MTSTEAKQERAKCLKELRHAEQCYSMLGVPPFSTLDGDTCEKLQRTARMNVGRLLDKLGKIEFLLHRALLAEGETSSHTFAQFAGAVSRGEYSKVVP